MKFPNYLISSLAIVGACSLIIMACSADNSSSANSVNSVGKYQISSTGSGTGFSVIDTETGVVKSYGYGAAGGGGNSFNLYATTITQP